MSKILNLIPGYRSRKVWKMVVATLYYIGAILLLVGGAGIGSVLIVLSCPYIVFGFAALIRWKKPAMFIVGLAAFIVGIILACATMETDTAITDTKPTVSVLPTDAVQTSTPSIVSTEISATVEPTLETTPELTAEQQEEMENDRKEEERSNYLLSCDDTLTYDELARNPARYENKRIGLRGKVIQSQENGLNVTLLMQVTLKEKNEYIELWDDIVYVTYTKNSSSDSRFLEGDIVSVYGVYQGIKSYETTLGATNQVPYIQAKYIL